MRNIIAVALWLWSVAVCAQSSVAGSRIALKVYPLAPEIALPGGAVNGALSVAPVFATGSLTRVRAVLGQAGDAMPGVGLNKPGIRAADEYAESLLDVDPQALPPPSQLNKGGCWFSNTRGLANIVVTSQAGDALPSSPAFDITVVCLHPSTVRLLPQQAGQGVRSWSAALVRLAGAEPLPIGLLAEVLPRSVPLADSQFTTQASGDGLHRRTLNLRLVAYAGSEFERRYPRRGGDIVARDIALQIHSSPRAR